MIVPSIDLMGGQAVQLVGGREHALDGGDPMEWCRRFAPVGEIAVVDLDAALDQGDNADVVRSLVRRTRVRVGGGIRDLETAYRWLRAGAERIVIGTAATPEFLRDLPGSRVIVALDAIDGDVVVDGWRTRTGASIEERMEVLGPWTSGFLVTLVEREGRLVGTDLDRARALRAAAGSLDLTLAGGIHTPEEIAALDRMGIDAQVGMALYDGSLSLADAFLAPLRSDRPDGLWPTVVADREGRALGLVYSNRESVTEALASGTGVYWSRSRGLWRKGATSGATQRLIRMDPDCDRDALRFTVEQEGDGFCHRGTAGCWGDLGGLGPLERRVAQRLEAPAATSYTVRLRDDPTLLGEKLREEAAELAEATTPEHVAWEAADLAYFATVALARAGLRWADVARELEGRRDTTGPGAPPAERPEPTERTEESPRRSEGAALLTPVDAPTLAAEPRDALDPSVVRSTRPILEAVRRVGDAALIRFAHRFGEGAASGPLLLGRAELRDALLTIPARDRSLLERTAERIRAFAEAQRQSLLDVDVAVQGGRAGHVWMPVSRVGCYVPGGRYPLPSSLLMTAIPARVAGVEQVTVSSPQDSPLMRAAAAVADVDCVLAVGGAHGVAALAYGTESVDPVDLIVGPGNAWVTAAKFLVSDRVGIDMLAGPSEVLVVAGSDASAERVAADLLAQAEHDPDARCWLVALDADVVPAVEAELSRQLHALPTSAVARRALQDHGRVIVCSDPEAVRGICDRLAPEHLQLSGARAATLAETVRTYGALFIGEESAEVFGDYGVGPNHVLPTGGSARYRAGLGVGTFLQARTWVHLDAPENVVPDAVALARLEGLEAHARAAALRAPKWTPGVTPPDRA